MHTTAKSDLCMMMALPQNQSDSGRGLFIITAASYHAALMLHVTQHGVTRRNATPMSPVTMQPLPKLVTCISNNTHTHSHSQHGFPVKTVLWLAEN